MELFLPNYILDILERFRAAGFEAYVAGGAVRDLISGITPHDYDLCTEALPEETKALFSGEQVIETGIRHGTVTVMADGHPVEITTFRSEGTYSDGRHPDEVSFVRDLKEDMSRRDFTVNAMAYSPETGVVDYFGGIEDLQKGILRCVGDPDQRFSEDGLRIMRALRFLSVKGYQPDQGTDAAIRRGKHMLEKVAGERIHEELLKFLSGARAAELLDSYRNVFAVVIPELRPMFGFNQKSPYHNRDVWHHSLAAVRSLRPDPQLRLTMLLHDIAKPVVFVEDENGRGHFKGHQKRGSLIADEILRRLKFPGSFTKEIVALIREHDLKVPPERPAVRYYLNELGEDMFRKLLDIQMADASGKYEKFYAEAETRVEAVRKLMDAVLADGDCISLADLAVNGSDLLEAGIGKGRQIGDTLSYLLKEVIEDRLPNEKEALLSAAAEQAAGQIQ